MPRTKYKIEGYPVVQLANGSIVLYMNDGRHGPFINTEEVTDYLDTLAALRS